MVDFLRRHWETARETLNIKNNKDFYGELQTVTTKKPIIKNVLAFIRKQQYLQWPKKLFRDALWTDILACITQATICYYPVASAPSFGKQGFLNGDNSETFF